MDWTAIFNFLLLAGSIQGFLFNAATLLARKRIEAPVILLNLFVLVLSLNNLQTWVLEKGLLTDYYYLSRLVIPWYVLIVPAFYAFLVRYLGVVQDRIPYLWPTLIIFGSALVLRLVLISQARAVRISDAFLEEYNYWEDLVTLAYSLFLYFKAYRLLFRHSDRYQTILSYDNLNWLKTFMKLGAAIMALWLVAILLNLFSELIRPPYSYYPLRLGTSILIYWVGYQAFFRYVLLQDRLMLRKQLQQHSPKVPGRLSGAKPPGNDDRGRQDFERIDAYVGSSQRYQDPILGQEQLASELGMGTSTLSRLINQHSGQNFSDYLNSYRVEQAKELLTREEFQAYTVVAIGLECGFNSKSTFYSAFRKLTGQSPTEYRKSASGTV